MAAIKHPRFATPAGIARYPWLNKPDTKFVKGGEYKIDLILTDEQLDAPMKLAKSKTFNGMSLRDGLQKILDDHYDEVYEAAKPAARKKLKKVDFIHNEVDDDGDETGRQYIKAKLKAKVETENASFEQKPKLVDSKKNPLVEAVYGGSIVKLSIEPVAYYSAKDKDIGVTLRLKGVQIIELAEYEADDGFEEEDGFETSGKSNNSSVDDDEEDDEENDEEDDF